MAWSKSADNADPLADVVRPGTAAGGELALLAHVDEVDLRAGVELRLHLVHGGFADARLGGVDDLQESRAVMTGHGAIVDRRRCVRQVNTRPVRLAP
jgi:hypothetical protein